jgi:hypothetical protein
LKAEAPARTPWKSRFGKGHVPVVRHDDNADYDDDDDSLQGIKSNIDSHNCLTEHVLRTVTVQ